MIIGKLQDVSMDEEVSSKVYRAIEYLESIDKNALSLGRHEINDFLYMQVLEYETEDANNFSFETHEVNLDLHYIVEGMEAIQVCDARRLIKSSAYIVERDIQYYGDTQDYQEVNLVAGDYLFINYNEAHKTNCNYKGSVSKVRKIVIKIKI